MPQQERLIPMPNWEFRLMMWTMNLMGSSAPKRRLTRVPLRSGMTVVDYACGPGRYTIPLAEAVGPQGRVYAIDIQPLAIEIVKKKAVSKGLANIETVLVDSYHSGIPDAGADLVLLLDVIHGIHERDVLFREIHRLLKPSGLLFMDSGHASTREVKAQVEATGLFTMVKFDGRDMLLSKK